MRSRTVRSLRAVVMASLPLVILAHNLENVLDNLERSATQRLFLYIVLQCAWTVLVVVFARKRLDNKGAVYDTA